jgi:hypothetical protein
LGNPHVAYTDGQVLKYAIWTGSSWSIQTVDNYSEIPFQLSLALDSNNTPYILYDLTISIPENGVGYSGNDLGAYYHLQNLKLAVYGNSSWNIQNVTSNAGGFGNMVLDSKGHPHLIYEVNYPEITGTNNSTLVYASWTGSALKTQTVVSHASLVNVGFLALDSHDYPHIAYINGTEGYSGILMYASWTSRAWDIQTVDSNIIALNNYATGPCYLALDSNGNPHISYLANPPDAGLPSPILYMMYATTIEPTQVSSLTFSAFPLLLVLTVVIIVAVVTVVYVWKKKTQKKPS